MRAGTGRWARKEVRLLERRGGTFDEGLTELLRSLV